MVACHEEAFPAQKIASSGAALKRWLSTLPAGTRIGLEATGGYHEPIAEFAHARGYTVYVLNPQDIRQYARALGKRGKTDRLDALVIAAYVAQHAKELHPFVPLTDDEKLLRDLARRRCTLINVRSMLKQSLRVMPGFETEARELIRAIGRFADRLERKLSEVAARSQQRGALVRRLQTIDGVGTLTSIRCATLFTRLPLRRSDSAVAFFGIDPRPHDSSHHHGRRRLSKRGPSEDRRLLFNAGMSAIKTPTWKPLYQHLRNKGFASTEAIIIIARRIVRIAFAMYKNQCDFNPKLVPKPVAAVV
jgi:transposase